jgi:hypothetical protein
MIPANPAVALAEKGITMNSREIAPAILVAMAVLVLSACGPSTATPDAGPDAGAGAATPTATPRVQPPTETPIPIQTPTPAVLADCFLSFQLAAWQDLDRDGVWGASEPPLEGVEFRLQGTFAQMWGDPYLSGADGRLTISTWSPGGCTERDYAITALPPASYQPTTADSVTFSLGPGDSHHEAQFGFRDVSE